MREAEYNQPDYANTAGFQRKRIANITSYESRLVELLSTDLDFHTSSSRDFTHDLHAFPAKFPPQLPRKFINGLTRPGDVVLDPMMGSGTTILEALLAKRNAIGFDIDPLALRLCNVKTTVSPAVEVARLGLQVLKRAKQTAQEHKEILQQQKFYRFDPKTREFIDYWFHPDAQIELLALLIEIELIESIPIRAFLELTVSSVIITKSGGVSMALDLAHTRPHKVRDKPYRSAFKEYEKRLRQNLKSLDSLPPMAVHPVLSCGNVQALPLRNDLVDLIVTSPPYPSNAIDYMRAHKFSLVWFDYPIQTLSQIRKKYIGGETVSDIHLELLPPHTSVIIAAVAREDQKKANALSRYYSEMSRALSEMHRVLKPGKAAIVVVGSSTLRGIDTMTHACLMEIGAEVGFRVPFVGVRQLDRDRRMLPVRRNRGKNTQIENRMHEEYVIGFVKPEREK